MSLNNNEEVKGETVRETFARFMQSDDDTIIKGEAIKDVIEKVSKEVSQEEVYVLSNVNNETKTFIVRKMSFMKGSSELLMCKMQYAYLKKISTLIGYGIMAKEIDKEDYLGLDEKIGGKGRMS